MILFTDDAGGGPDDDDIESSITGIVIGSRECVPTDELGNVYNMEVNSTSHEGKVSCIPAGSFIGPMNVTVYVSGKFGKSVVDKDGDAVSVNSKGKLFTYHTLPEISAVAPNVGGHLGGTHVKILGKSFDSFTEPKLLKT